VVASRLGAVVRKELIQIWRDRRTLYMVLALPLIQLLLFGYAINTTVEHQPMVVLDQADDRLSRDFVGALVHSNVFDVVATARDAGEVRELIDRGVAKIGVVIPPDYARDLAAGRSPEVQVLVDASDSTVAQTALLSAVAIGQAHSAELLMARLEQLGQGAQMALIDVRTLALYNPALQSINFTVPGLVGMIMANIITFLTAFAVVREREHGTLEQLIVTPIRAWELMVGKMLPYVLIAYVDVLGVLAIGTFWFGVPIAGNLGLLLALAGIFLMSSIGMGLLISTVSRTQGQAAQLGIFTLLPNIILSGFIFPRESMPTLLHHLGYLLPLTYFLKILRGIMMKGVGLTVLWTEVLPMALLALLMLALSVARFQKKLA
jgi:drug efflux transport system permease protein